MIILIKLKNFSFLFSNRLEPKTTPETSSNTTKNHIRFFFVDSSKTPAKRLIKNKMGDTIFSNIADGNY